MIFPAFMCYGLAMRSSTLIALVLAAAFLLACGDDPPVDEMPADGTVQAWDACAWEGSVDDDLCAAGLVCTDNGVCIPACERDEDCAAFEFGDVCETKTCIIKCDDTKPCPETGGVALKCSVALKECV